MQQEQALQRVKARLTLVLDTTYCSPQFLFPPQLQVTPLTARTECMPFIYSMSMLILALWGAFCATKSFKA